jgi:signal transduction histidine kinase
VAAEFDRRAGERGVRLEPRPADGACWAMADPGALARIVRILIDNALGVAPGGSAVRLEPSTEEGQARIVVADEGPGVPADERERIFERFQRGSTTGGRSGFGLGLAIGREMAQRMGGGLSLLQDGERDAGARFAISLPLAGEDQDEEEGGP